MAEAEMNVGRGKAACCMKGESGCSDRGLIFRQRQRRWNVRPVVCSIAFTVSTKGIVECLRDFVEVRGWVVFIPGLFRYRSYVLSTSKGAINTIRRHQRKILRDRGGC